MKLILPAGQAVSVTGRRYVSKKGYIEVYDINHIRILKDDFKLKEHEIIKKKMEDKKNG